MARRLFNARNLVLGGLAVAAAAGALKNRHRVAGLLGGGPTEPAPYTPPTPAPAPPPAVANADVSGPPANTATPVPAPDPEVRGDGGIDEEAEEAAAAAEAANIGGTVSDYAGTELGERADEEERPLAEAGEGVSEGFEQAEDELEDNAEPAAGDPVEGERQVEEVIEEQDQPQAGEVLEPTPASAADGETDPAGPADTEVHADQLSIDSPPAPDPATRVSAPAPDTAGTVGPDETPAAEKSANVWRAEDQPTVEQPATEKPDGDDDDGGSEWQTWSGRAVDR